MLLLIQLPNFNVGFIKSAVFSNSFADFLFA